MAYRLCSYNASVITVFLEITILPTCVLSQYVELCSKYGSNCRVLCSLNCTICTAHNSLFAFGMNGRCYCDLLLSDWLAEDSSLSNVIIFSCKIMSVLSSSNFFNSLRDEGFPQFLWSCSSRAELILTDTAARFRTSDLCVAAHHWAFILLLLLSTS